MSSRMFQGIILQIKEATTHTVGVLDSSGTVVACTDLGCIGERREWAPHEIMISETGLTRLNGYVYKPLAGSSAQFDFAAFVSGEDSVAEAVCKVAVVALSGAKAFYEEKHDKATLIKNILMDNILPEDIFSRARELMMDSERSRVVMLIHQVGHEELAVTDVVHSLFPDRQYDFVINLNMRDVALVKEVSPSVDSGDLIKLASAICETINSELLIKTVIGIGSVVGHVKDLANSLKEAQVAIDVGRVFDTEKPVIHYENLGIGRLIYQLPTTMCEMFLSEVFKKNTIETLDQETLFTIQKFFENNLNVSETSRKLFVHRNTLVYRLEKIKKLTGLDLREFDHAIIFKVALMVKRYLGSQGVRY
ncbi:MAG: helix-turn-helix domain-containing protein [Oscillospiraceae bacterium]|nr:helix-turn-helix domain-containing protein [Oscillospiraceae bacterium]